MAQNSDLTVLDGLLKKVYGKGVHQAVPDNVKEFFDLMPFSASQERLGDKFCEAINLGLEQGVTFGGGTPGVVTLNAPQSGRVKQAIVDASMIAMQCVVSWDVVAKANGTNTNQSFERGVTQIIDNVLISHRRWQATALLYGTDNIGIISAGAASATQTITKASCAPGLFYGSDNAFYDIYDVTLGNKKNSGAPLKLVGYNVDPSGATRTLTFDATVTTVTGDVIVPATWVASGAYVMTPGLSTICGVTGQTLFGLSQTTYSMFQPCVFDAGGVALSLKLLDQAVILPLIRGYSGKSKLFCSPGTFSNLSLEETSRVQLINGNATGTAKIGFDTMVIKTSSGANLTVVPHPFIKEGEAYVFPTDGSLRRIGACDIKLGGPLGEPVWQRLMPAATGYMLPTFSLMTAFTAEPWKCLKIKNIVNS